MCKSNEGLQKAKNDGKLLDIKFDNIEYFSFDVTNKEISDLFDVQYQTTLLILKVIKKFIEVLEKLLPI